jgi:hypothetical protein
LVREEKPTVTVPSPRTGAIMIVLAVAVSSTAAADLAQGAWAEQLARQLEERIPDYPLTIERLRQAVATVSEAEAWPRTWLVLQDMSRSDDLLVHVDASDEAGALVLGTALAVDRRDWDFAAIREAVREATGKKPREKVRSVVIQGFRTRTEIRYVYENAGSTEDRQGLMVHLPEDAILREATSVDLGDGSRHTLAIVLFSAEFLPATCDRCADAVFGHADTGRIEIVLAGEDGIVDRVDLTDHLQGYDGRPLVPRFPCGPRDLGVRPDESTVRSWMADRQPEEILVPEDVDGDGRALEYTLPADYRDCESLRTLVVGIDPVRRSLRIGY